MPFGREAAVDEPPRRDMAFAVCLPWRPAATRSSGIHVRGGACRLTAGRDHRAQGSESHQAGVGTSSRRSRAALSSFQRSVAIDCR